VKRDTTSYQKQGFVKLMRSPESQELLINDPLAFALLAVIALRARWRAAFSLHGLQFGEALMGDYKKIGFTRKQYRTRLKRLADCGLVTTRPTRRGTIVRLVSNSVFEVVFSPNECLTANKSNKKGPTDLPLKNAVEGLTGGQQGANRGPLTDTDKPQTKNSELITLDNSTPSTSNNGKRQSDSLGEGYQNQNQPAQSHVKWPEFAEWCRAKGGRSTEKGFWKWLLGQKPQWRNRVKQVVEEPGYVLDGQFLTAEEANRRGVESPALLTRFRKAVKRGGKIIVDETRTWANERFFTKTVMLKSAFRISTKTKGQNL
jgi:hypothetical protein